MLVKGIGAIFCLPLLISLQDENEVFDAWRDKIYYGHRERILMDAFHTASIIGCCMLVLDRYFITEALLRLYDELCFYSKNFNRLHLIMRCKESTVGFEFP